MPTTQKERDKVIHRLANLGITVQDVQALRRISLTLQRWFERECGDSNTYGSWAIERDEQTDAPYLVHHHYNHGGKDYTTRTPIPDREAGARKRLARILAKYPSLHAYVQTDPRGCALYILTHDQATDGGHALESIYSRGIAVY